MAKSDVICGLDMGSGRVTCVLGAPSEEDGKVEILGAATVPCRGLKGGVVVNIGETAHAVSEAVERAESAAEVEVKDVYLGVRGSHLKSFNNRGAINIARTDKEITAEDVQNVIENAKAIPISNDREILHVVPQDYALDRQRGVFNPVGMEGSLLEAEVHIVHASSSHLSNLIKSVNKAGFNVIESVYSLLALGDQVLTPEERDLGALLIDMGGQTVSLGIYSGGSVRYSKEIELGSDFITRDLAFGLRTSLGEAEKIKERHGVALSSLLSGDEEVSFLGVDGSTPHKIQTRTLLEYIQPRVEQIFTVLAEDLQASNYMDVIAPGGGILTGGGGLLKGMPEAGTEMLGFQVRLGRPRREGLTGPEDFLTPSYGSALALVAYPFRATPGGPPRAAKKSGIKRKLSALFEDIF